MDADEFVLLLIGLTLLAFTGLFIWSVNWQNHAQCSEFKNYTIKNVPARCASQYVK